MRKLLIAVAVAAALVGPAASPQSAEKKTLAFVINGASDFWRQAEAGVRKAQGELPGYTLLFKIPEQSTVASQTRLMDELVAAGVAGIVVSPVDAKGMVGAIDRVAGRAALFTTDSDAPNSKRTAYIGTSNIDAGKQAAQLMQKALPSGGKCMGFVGLADAANARGRIEGIRESLKGSKINLVEVRADDFDLERARRNVEDTIAKRPDINCMVGLYSYNTPLIYDVLKKAGKLGRIAIIGFDEDPVTLGGVKDGTIVGTIVGQPFEWGYLGMTAMAKFLEGDKSFIPANRLIILPTKIIDRSNIEPFWTELKAQLRATGK